MPNDMQPARRGLTAFGQAALASAVLALAGGLLAGCGASATGKPGAAAPGGAAMSAQAAVKPAATLHSADLVGWTSTELHHRLGRPVLTFIETPAEVWRYSAPSCVVLVFLYPQDAAPGGQAIVRHVEVLPRVGSATGDIDHCLREIEALATA